MSEETQEATHGRSGIDGMGSSGGVRDCAASDYRQHGTVSTGPRLRDIVILLLFAVLLRIAETFDRDTPGWWLEGSAHDWRMAVDADALERRENGDD